MKRDIIIKKTFDNISKLPDQSLIEISNFAEFLINKAESEELLEGIQKLATDSKVYKFLEDEEEIYSLEDLKEIYK